MSRSCGRDFEIVYRAGIYTMTSDGTACNLVLADNSVKTLTVDKGSVPHTLYAGTNVQR